MICPNPDCKRIVSPYDEKCQHCGTPLKDHPAKDYIKKADKIISDAEAGANDIKEQIRTGFKKEISHYKTGPIQTSAYHGTFKDSNHKVLSEKDSAEGKYDQLYSVRSDDVIKITMQRKDVKVEEMKRIVLASPHVTANEDYSPKVAVTDFRYRRESPDDRESCEVNAYAFYNEKTDRYEIHLLDGYLNFMLLVESFFKLSDQTILVHTMNMMARREGLLSQQDALEIMSSYVRDESSFFSIIENAFIPCFETIAHEFGHICLGHCRNTNLLMPHDVSRNQEREADSFASSVLGSMFHADARKPLFVSYLKCQFAWAFRNRVIRDVLGGNVRASTHPLAEERLLNAVRANSELAQELGITEDWFHKLMDALMRLLRPESQSEHSVSKKDNSSISRYHAEGYETTPKCKTCNNYQHRDWSVNYECKLGHDTPNFGDTNACDDYEE